MVALRLALLGVSVTACAWFALLAVEAHDVNRATALMQQPGRPSPSVTKEILHLLDGASTLNPDQSVALLRVQADGRADRFADAIRTAQAVVRAEPQNIYGWLELGFISGHGHAGLSALAARHVRQLAPPVPPAP